MPSSDACCPTATGSGVAHGTSPVLAKEIADARGWVEAALGGADLVAAISLAGVEGP
ncbi:MAG: hypothetical protein H0V93_03000 [Euzebyales bacterium]|jgi:hypothetical protein|nr:hypothetical protein [Euzebyales bacterium]